MTFKTPKRPAGPSVGNDRPALKMVGRKEGEILDYMNEEKRQVLAQLLIGITKKEWEFVRDRIDTEFASAAHKAVLLGDAEAIAKAMKDTWNED